MTIFRAAPETEAKEIAYKAEQADSSPPVETANNANGTSIDGHDMYRMGKKQEFQVRPNVPREAPRRLELTVFRETFVSCPCSVSRLC